MLARASSHRAAPQLRRRQCVSVKRPVEREPVARPGSARAANAYPRVGTTSAGRKDEKRELSGILGRNERSVTRSRFPCLVVDLEMVPLTTGAVHETDPRDRDVENERRAGRGPMTYRSVLRRTGRSMRNSRREFTVHGSKDAFKGIRRDPCEFARPRCARAQLHLRWSE